MNTKHDMYAADCCWTRLKEELDNLEVHYEMRYRRDDNPEYKRVLELIQGFQRDVWCDLQVAIRAERECV